MFERHGVYSVEVQEKTLLKDDQIRVGNAVFSHLFNLLKPTGHVIQQQFNIQQLYVLPTLYLCVLYLSENRQRFVPLTA